jgi:hypothetical protein
VAAEEGRARLERCDSDCGEGLCRESILAGLKKLNACPIRPLSNGRTRDVDGEVHHWISHSFWDAFHWLAGLRAPRLGNKKVKLRHTRVCLTQLLPL